MDSSLIAHSSLWMVAAGNCSWMVSKPEVIQKLKTAPDSSRESASVYR
jgi:hypothetical protein